MSTRQNADILLIEDSTAIIDLFKVLTKKFDLKIKYAKNTSEFLNIIRFNSFKYVLCDLNLDYKLEGLFISKVFSNIRKIQQTESKILLFSSEKVTEKEISKSGFDGSLVKDFLSIYDFLLQNFPLRSFHDLLVNEMRYQVASFN